MFIIASTNLGVSGRRGWDDRLHFYLSTSSDSFLSYLLYLFFFVLARSFRASVCVRVCLSTSARYNCLIVSNATASFPRQRFAKSLISSYWTARILEGLYWLSCLCLCSTHTLMKSQVCGTFCRPHTNTHGMFRPCTLLSDHICPISHVHFSHSLTLPS